MIQLAEDSSSVRNFGPAGQPAASASEKCWLHIYSCLDITLRRVAGRVAAMVASHPATDHLSPPSLPRRRHAGVVVAAGAAARRF